MVIWLIILKTNKQNIVSRTVSLYCLRFPIILILIFILILRFLWIFFSLVFVFKQIQFLKQYRYNSLITSLPVSSISPILSETIH